MKQKRTLLLCKIVRTKREKRKEREKEKKGVDLEFRNKKKSNELKMINKMAVHMGRKESLYQ